MHIQHLSERQIDALVPLLIEMREKRAELDMVQFGEALVRLWEGLGETERGALAQ
jgi:hypothetical protein